jgi:hypothetical protein
MEMIAAAAAVVLVAQPWILGCHLLRSHGDGYDADCDPQGYMRGERTGSCCRGRLDCDDVALDLICP